MSKGSRTQIIATLGPSSVSSDVIEKMIGYNMDVARLNLSWGNHDEHRQFINTVREIGNKLGKTVLILADLSGPREQSKDGHRFSGKEGSVITEKDKKDLAFALKNKVEYIALSYVGNEYDVIELRKLIKEGGGNAKIIAKIERREAVDNIDGILKVSDAIMIARGDLGNDFPIEAIPFIQHDLINLAKKAGKTVIVATEMMPSMINRKIPTRSDVTDVANAVILGADAVMLSDETTIGEYPALAVKMMERIAIEAEGRELGANFHPL